MSWRTIAYKDVHDASRSKTIWLVFGLLSVLSVGYAVAHRYLGPPEFLEFLSGLAELSAAVLPILGLLLGYKSIVDERTSGSLLLSLSLPHSRRELIVGKFVGRTVVLLAPTLVALSVAGIVGMARYGTDGAMLYPWFLFVTALYGTAFVGLAIGLSMSTTVDRWITFGAFGGYLLLVVFWENAHSLVLLILHRFDFSVLRALPDWALFARLLKPGESYFRLLRAGFDVGLAEMYVGDGVPLYVDWWMGIVVLVAWVVVPLVLGFRRFRTADL